MKFKHTLWLAACSVILLSAIFFAGCVEHTIDPFEDDSGAYSFYGFLIVGENPNYVRVRDLREPFLSEESVLDARVTFENTRTGSSVELRDTTVNFGGNITRNFIIEQEIEHNTTYLLSAERSDGVLVESIAKTPAKTEVNLNPDNRNPDNPSIFTSYCDAPIEITFKNVVDPEFIDMTFSIRYNDQIETGPLSYFMQEIKHVDGADEMTIEMSPRNMLVEIFPPPPPDDPFFDPYDLVPLVDCSQLTDTDMHIEYRHFSQEWDVGRPFRGAVDIESGDVMNGLGLFGAFRDDEFSFPFEKECLLHRFSC